MVAAESDEMTLPAESRRIFESALEGVRRVFRLQIYGYVVMPEHC